MHCLCLYPDEVMIRKVVFSHRWEKWKELWEVVLDLVLSWIKMLVLSCVARGHIARFAYLLKNKCTFSLLILLRCEGPVWWQWKDGCDSVCVGTAIISKPHKCSSSAAGGAALGQADVSDQEAVQVMGLQWPLEEVDENEDSVFQVNSLFSCLT